MNATWRGWMLKSKIGIIGGILILWNKNMVAAWSGTELSSVETAAIMVILFSMFTWVGFKISQ